MNMKALREMPVDDKLPAPASDAEFNERLADLEAIYVADGWEGIKRPEQHRATLKQYALGEIGLSEAMKVFAHHEPR